ncbi:MAG: hypothetical protein VKJ04_09605 [Vampirovibrionales bacterium]|nr:hypothetical protein [Vampirovibrionales bacterium]
MMTLIIVLHLAGLFVWIGSLLFPLIALKAQPLAYLESLQRVKPWVMGAMALSVVTGTIQIMSLGGFKALPMAFHIKLTLALVMLAITLLQFLYFLPKAQQSLSAGHSAADVNLLKGLTICATSSILCALAILYILASLGIL